MKRVHDILTSEEGEKSSKCPFHLDSQAPLPPPLEEVPPPPEEKQLPAGSETPTAETANGDPSSSDWLSPYAILDEYDYFKADDDPTNGRVISPDDQDDSDQMSYDSSEESEVPLDEIDNMLEEGLLQLNCSVIIFYV